MSRKRLRRTHTPRCPTVGRQRRPFDRPRVRMRCAFQKHAGADAVGGARSHLARLAAVLVEVILEYLCTHSIPGVGQHIRPCQGRRTGTGSACSASGARAPLRQPPRSRKSGSEGRSTWPPHACPPCQEKKKRAPLREAVGWLLLGSQSEFQSRTGWVATHHAMDFFFLSLPPSGGPA